MSERTERGMGQREAKKENTIICVVSYPSKNVLFLSLCSGKGRMNKASLLTSPHGFMSFFSLEVDKSILRKILM